ncbi:MAG: hypothetical protein ACT4P9_07910 [Betaproteobacteria bacterium]
MAQVAEDVPRVAREREHSVQPIFVGMLNDGERVASVDFAGFLHLWDAKTLRQIADVRNFQFMVAAAGVIGRATLIGGGFRHLDVIGAIDLDRQEGMRVLGRSGGDVLGFSGEMRSGKIRAVVGNSTDLRVLEVSLTEEPRLLLTRPAEKWTTMAISPDGTYVAVAALDKTVRLIEVDSGKTVWQQTTEEPLRSISIAPRAPLLIGAYDLSWGGILKRIDHFDLRDGRLLHGFSTDPCTVVQVNALSDHQGFAICNPSIFDALKGITLPSTSFMRWRTDDGSSTPVRFTFDGAFSPYMPVAQAGVATLPLGNNVLVSTGDGGLYVVSPPGNESLKVRRLAPSPTKVGRFAISPNARHLVVLPSELEKTGTAASKRTIERLEFARILSLTARLDVPGDELRRIFVEGFDAPFEFPSRTLKVFDTDSVTSRTIDSEFIGPVKDIAIVQTEGRSVLLAIETLPSMMASPLEQSSFALARVSLDNDSTSVTRRVFSLDGDKGLLKTGFRRSARESKYGGNNCNIGGDFERARLSADGNVVAIACMVLHKEKPSPDSIVHDTYDVLTLALGGRNAGRAARVRFEGTPKHIELSKDGSVVAIMASKVHRQPGNVLQPFASTHALLVADARTGKVTSEVALPQEAEGQRIAIVPGTNQVLVAVGGELRRVDGGGKVSVVPLRSDAPNHAISAIAVDAQGTFMVVARSNAISEVFHVTGGERLVRAFHYGEDVEYLSFIGATDPGGFVGAIRNGGLAIWSLKLGGRAADLLSFHSGEWIIFAPDGVFASSVGGVSGVTVSTKTSAVGIDQLFDLYFRPDILKKRLIGQAAAAPSNAGIRIALSKPPPDLVAKWETGPVATAKLAISLKDSGGGIGGLRIFHNGKLSYDPSAAELWQVANVVASNPSVISLDIEVPVAAGANEYLVTSLNSERSLQSRFERVRGTNGPAVAPVRKGWVLVVGTNSFERADIKDLRFAEVSANRVAAAFRGIFATMLGAENVEVVDFVGSNSRADRVEQGLRRLETAAQPDDLVAFVVVTHGEVSPEGELYALLGDSRNDGSNSLTSSRLLQAVNRTKALTQILVLDICRSGAMTDKVAAIYQERFAAFAGSAGVHVMMSASAEERAVGAFSNSTMFSHFLLEGLNKPREANARSRSLIHIARTAAKRVEDTARQYAIQQIPGVFSYGKDLLFP